jgi:hypothetical protein
MGLRAGLDMCEKSRPYRDFFLFNSGYKYIYTKDIPIYITILPSSQSPPTPRGIRSPDFPARSQSLYRLSYPGPQQIHPVMLYLDSDGVYNKSELNKHDSEDGSDL